jgi:hypothetical protein
MEDAALYGFQAIFNSRYCAFEDYIGCIVQEPGLILTM